MQQSNQFEIVLQEMIALNERKGRDYGTANDSLAGLRSVTQFGLPAHLGATLRMNEKMNRLKALFVSGSLVNESAEDTYLDIAVLSIQALIMLRDSVT